MTGPTFLRDQDQPRAFGTGPPSGQRPKNRGKTNREAIVLALRPYNVHLIAYYVGKSALSLASCQILLYCRCNPDFVIDFYRFHFIGRTEAADLLSPDRTAPRMVQVPDGKIDHITSPFLMIRRSPPTVPILKHGTECLAAIFSSPARSLGSTLNRIRDGASPNKISSRRPFPENASTWSSAPRIPFLLLMQDSAAQTASPPSDRSCALRTSPARMASRHAAWIFFSNSISIPGFPLFCLWIC